MDFLLDTLFEIFADGFIFIFDNSFLSSRGKKPWKVASLVVTFLLYVALIVFLLLGLSGLLQWMIWIPIVSIISLLCLLELVFGILAERKLRSTKYIDKKKLISCLDKDVLPYTDFSPRIFKRSQIIDSSKGKEDIRVSFFAESYVIKVRSFSFSDSDVMAMNRLAGRYSSIGLNCPLRQEFKDHSFTKPIMVEGKSLYVSIEGRAKGFALHEGNELTEGIMWYSFSSLSEVANNWTGFDLGNRPAAFSVLEEGLSWVSKRLKEYLDVLGACSLSYKLKEIAGSFINNEGVYSSLPSSCFQGDISKRHLIVDFYKSKYGAPRLLALVGFDSFGKDANIHRFILETCPSLSEDEICCASSLSIFEQFMESWQGRLNFIFETYRPSEKEKEAIHSLQLIDLLFGKANFSLFIELLKNKEKKEATTSFILFATSKFGY